jgi:hypothetical protein
MFNLIAFVSAARSAISIIQNRFKSWYDKKMKADLEKHEDFKFFSSSQVEFFQEENLRQEIFAEASKTTTFRYNIGSETGKNDELTEGSSERESPITIIHNPAAEKASEKYEWRFKSMEKRSVILSCAEYLAKLSILINECEKENSDDAK